MDMDELIEILRLDYGVSEAAYSDEQLTRFINKAIKKLSEYYPVRGMAYLTTVANQTRYTVNNTEENAISGFIRIRNVYYGENMEENIWGDPDIKESSKTSSYTMSQHAELISRLELMNQISPRSAEIIGHNQFDLIPTPETSGEKVYYEYDVLREIEDIPEVFEEDLVNLVFFFSSSKDYHKTIASASSNSFQFDRRGNSKTQADVSKTQVQEQRTKQLADIVKSIRDKVKRF